LPSFAACSLHRVHRPKNLTVDFHHVVPRAWQNFHLGEDKLFDPRTVPICPTGHRNVHFWIVQFMKANLEEDPLLAKKAVFGNSRLNSEAKTALLALQRWKEAGLSLNSLRSAGQFGRALRVS
jgi:hypothetical protein